MPRRRAMFSIQTPYKMLCEKTFGPTDAARRRKRAVDERPARRCGARRELRPAARRGGPRRDAAARGAMRRRVAQSGGAWRDAAGRRVVQSPNVRTRGIFSVRNK